MAAAPFAAPIAPSATPAPSATAAAPELQRMQVTKLARLPKLRKLDLSGCSQVSSLKPFARHTNLTELKLRETTVTPLELSWLLRCKGLRLVELLGCIAPVELGMPSWQQATSRLLNAQPQIRLTTADGRQIGHSKQSVRCHAGGAAPDTPKRTKPARRIYSISRLRQLGIGACAARPESLANLECVLPMWTVPNISKPLELNPHSAVFKPTAVMGLTA